MLVAVRREGYCDCGVGDGVHFGEEVFNVAERCLAVDEVIQNAAERPHVTLDTDLKLTITLSYMCPVVYVKKRNAPTLNLDLLELSASACVSCNASGLM